MAKQEKKGKKDVIKGIAPNVLYKPFVLLHYTDILPVCSTSKYLMKHICNNEEFWYEKTVHDFGRIKKKKGEDVSWKEYYKNVILENQKKLIPSLENAKLEHIQSLCKTQPIVDVIICQNDKFWKDRTMKHFGEPDKEPKDGEWEKYYTTLYHETKPVIVMGDNSHGQLGISEDDIPEDKIIEYIQGYPGVLPYYTGFRAKSVSCRGDSSFIIDAYNNVLASGENKSGQLGLGDTKIRKVFTKIPNFKAKKVAAGNGFTIFIGMDDTLWGCGMNTDGQLGSLKDKIVMKPTMISNMKFWLISAGYSHAAALDDQNYVYTFGKNDKYQLGIKSKNKGNTLYKTGLIGEHLGCGNNHTIVITENYKAIGFGDNSEGQLSLEGFKAHLPTDIESYSGDIFKVFCGGDGTLMIGQNDDVIVTGKNTGNSLGLGLYYEFGIDEDGEQYEIDEPELDDVYENADTLEHVHTVSYVNGNTVRTLLKGKKAALSGSRMIVIDDEGRIFVAGENGFSELGVSNEYNDTHFPESVDIQELRGFKGHKVSTGASHTIILGDPIEK